MFGPFRQKRPRARTLQLAHEVVDAVMGGDLRRVLVVGDESEVVASILRQRLPEAAVVSLPTMDGLGRWHGWADLVVSAWTANVDEITLASRLREILPANALVAVLDRGAFALIDVWSLRFMGTTRCSSS